MKKLTYILLLLILPLFGFHTLHKYYISVTQVEYVSKEKSVQIISRIFIDDLEYVLKKRYDKTLTLNKKESSENIDFYIKKYLSEKLKININQQEKKLTFIGKKYDDNIVKCYLEIENISNIKSFEVSNTILTDGFVEQQNIVKTDINSKQKSFTLTKQHQKAFLEFN